MFDELGADVVAIGVEPNGLNINQSCGSTQPELLQKIVLEHQADVGIALDGDGDRVIMVDHKGELVDGDELLFIIAVSRLQDGTLQGGVVGTLMSNLGLEHALLSHKIDFVRANVGDRYVLELLQADQQHDRRRVLRPYYLPGSYHHRRRHRLGAAGAGRHGQVREDPV